MILEPFKAVLKSFKVDLVHNNALSGFSTDKANQMSVSHFRYKKKSSYQKHIDKKDLMKNSNFVISTKMMRYFEHLKNKSKKNLKSNFESRYSIINRCWVAAHSKIPSNPTSDY